MRGQDALAAALAMFQRPQLVHLARRSPLPKGVTFLLEIAAGDQAALRKGYAATGTPEPVLQRAAGFFIEQILLGPGAGSYRILGSDAASSPGDLRRNFALIMKWLHPDVFENAGSGQHFDRRVYASRVTKAWESIKTGDRRAAYDASLAPAGQVSPNRPTQRSRGADLPRRQHKLSRQLIVYRLEHETLWERLLFLFGSKR